MLKLFSLAVLVFMLIGCINQHKQSILKNSKDTSLFEQVENKVDSEKIFPNLSQQLLFKVLFDNPDVDTVNNEAKWMPNFSERMNFPISYDGKCHTGLDTIMYYTAQDSIERAVVLFGTYLYYNKNNRCGPHGEGAPIGIALFAKRNDGRWQVSTFNKSFTSLGLYVGADKKWRGSYSLLRMGDKWTCLELHQDNCANGGASGTEWLYSIEDNFLSAFPNQNTLNQILAFDTYIDDAEQNVKTKLVFIKHPKSYYDADLITTGEGKTGIKHYQFSEEANCYLEKK